MSSPLAYSEPERYRFTADGLLAMIAAGVIDAENYELLDGDLIHVTAKGPLHRFIAMALDRRLDRTLPPGFHAQKEECIAGEQRSLPEPDIAVIRGDPAAYRHKLPEGRDVVLAIEVSVSTLTEDRRKLPIFARAGVPTVWILDVEHRRLEVYTDNVGDRYAASLRLVEAERIEVPVTGEHWTVASMIDGFG